MFTLISIVVVVVVVGGGGSVGVVVVVVVSAGIVDVVSVVGGGAGVGGVGDGAATAAAAGGGGGGAAAAAAAGGGGITSGTIITFKSALISDIAVVSHAVATKKQYHVHSLIMFYLPTTSNLPFFMIMFSCGNGILAGGYMNVS